MALRLIMLVLAALTLLGAGGELPPDAEEERRLLDEKQRLEQRIAVLNREQDFLLFQQVFQQSDSKYLILDPASGKGQLKYRNRVLRTFSLERKERTSRDPAPGAVVLTGKSGPNGKARYLVFGNGLILEGRGRRSSTGPAARYGLYSRDLAALHYALEVGANAYIVAPHR